MLLTGVALLHGGPAAASAASPAGYTRSDGVNSVAYRALDNHIHELYLAGGGWRSGDLTAVTGAAPAAGDPHGYARSNGVNSVVYRAQDNRVSDGINAVVYRALDNHIHELSLDAAGWAHRRSHRADRGLELISRRRRTGAGCGPMARR